MADVAELQLQVSAQKAVNEINRTERELIGLGKTSDVTGARMTRNFNSVGAAAGKVKLLVTGIAGALAVRAGVATFARFEQQMSGVRAMTEATNAEMEKLNKLARQLGASTQFTAAQAAEGMQFMAMAGFEVNEILGAMPGTLDLAAAGMLDLGSAADIATNILSGFGMQAEEMGRVSDVLASAAASSNTNVFQLGEAMKFSAPIARVLGIQIEEVAASIGVLSNAGIQGGEAGTTLRRVFLSLINPTKEAERVIKSYGLSMEEVNPQIHGFTNVIEKLAKAGITAADAATVFEARGVTGFLALADAVPEIRKLNDQLNNVDGTSKRIAETKMDNLIGDWLKFKSAISEVVIAAGEDGLGGSLRDLVQSSTRATQWLIRNWNDIRDAAVMTILDIQDGWDLFWTSLKNGFDIGSSHIAAGWFDLKALVLGIYASLEEAFGRMMAKILEGLQKLVEKAQGILSSLPGGEGLANRLGASGANLGAMASGLREPSAARADATAAAEAASGLQDEAWARANQRNEAFAERSNERAQTKAAMIASRTNLSDTADQISEVSEASKDLNSSLEKLEQRNAFDVLGDSLQSFADGFEKAIDNFGNFQQRLSDMGEGIAYSIDQNLTDALTDFVMGTKSAKEAFRDFAQAMIADLIRIMIQQLIVRSLMSALGGIGGAPVAHAGGIAGDPTLPRRAVDPGVFSGASHFQGGGIAGDEVPVIAHRGEGIFTEEQMAALGQAINGQERQKPVEIINVADPSMVDERIAANPDAVLNVINRNRQSVRRLLGVGS